MTIGDPQSFNRYSYVNNDPVNKVDPLGLRLEDIGIIQTDDPAIANDLQKNSDDAFKRSVNDDYRRRHQQPLSRVNPFAAPSAKAAVGSNNKNEAAFGHAQQQSDLFGSTSSLVEVIIWSGTSKDPRYHFGHVSYVIDGVSYSWQLFKDQDGNETYYKRLPDVYFKEKRQQGAVGHGYVFNLGSLEANERFANSIIHAYDKWPHKHYDFITNNCGGAFLRTINAMNLPETRGLTGKNWHISPDGHDKFIQTHLMRYVVQETVH